MFPATLLPRIDHVSTGHVVDEEIRKRAKYLAHLPLGHEINFLECDWTDIVPAEILDRFAEDLERRRRKHQEKATREEKDRIRAEMSEDKKYYGTRRERTITSFKGKEIEPDAVSADELGGLSSSVDLTAPSTSPPWLSSERRHGSSFASLASPSTSPSGPRTVWGTPIVNAASPSLAATHDDHETVPENDGWLQNWENDLLQEEDLIARAKAASLDDNAGSSSQTAMPSSAPAGKKKKKTKITLMSTNGRRAA